MLHSVSSLGFGNAEKKMVRIFSKGPFADSKVIRGDLIPETSVDLFVKGIKEKQEVKRSYQFLHPDTTDKEAEGVFNGKGLLEYIKKYGLDFLGVKNK